MLDKADVDAGAAPDQPRRVSKCRHPQPPGLPCGESDLVGYHQARYYHHRHHHRGPHPPDSSRHVVRDRSAHAGSGPVDDRVAAPAGVK